MYRKIAYFLTYVFIIFALGLAFTDPLNIKKLWLALDVGIIALILSIAILIFDSLRKR